MKEIKNKKRYLILRKCLDLVQNTKFRHQKIQEKIQHRPRSKPGPVIAGQAQPKPRCLAQVHRSVSARSRCVRPASHSMIFRTAFDTIHEPWFLWSTCICTGGWSIMHQFTWKRAAQFIGNLQSSRHGFDLIWTSFSTQLKPPESYQSYLRQRDLYMVS